MKGSMLFSAVLLLIGNSLSAASLSQQTDRFYQNYLQSVEKGLNGRSQFLLIDKESGLRSRVRGGDVYVEEKRPDDEPPHGMIHHYEGAIFIPGAKIGDVMGVVQNYDQHKNWYSPEVIDSKILQKQGNDYLIRLRLLKKKVVTVVLETEHKVRYKQVDPKHWESVSRSVKVSEVEHPGSENEKQLPQGKGQGFVWHLDSFWRFAEADGGVYVECTSVSLSRDIPFGLGAIVRPIITDLPEDSLKGVLNNTLKAVRAQDRNAALANKALATRD